ncbi:MAG: phosphate signaling complex protein PhoU [Peptoniphilaceae bacterium]|nr:phosphate signaling complex protein PhoU [Peptoniphilaceae bacterium]MDY6085505.1 phosphate signaling complex protein PhoU [Peptoniphilaceae bacterium]
MRDKFEEQLEELNRDLTKMGDLCIESVEHSIKALLLQDKSLVEDVDSAEEAIDALCSRIESETLSLMMSQQPVASDFRFISSAMRMNTDLERLGDQAYNIGHFVKQLLDIGYEKRDLGSIDEMAKIALEMVRESVSAFREGNAQMALDAGHKDDQVDALYMKVRQEAIQNIRDNAPDPEFVVDSVIIAKYLERVADHAQNISEAVLYSVEGTEHRFNEE